MFLETEELEGTNGFTNSTDTEKQHLEKDNLAYDNTKEKEAHLKEKIMYDEPKKDLTNIDNDEAIIQLKDMSASWDDTSESTVRESQYISFLISL